MVARVPPYTAKQFLKPNSQAYNLMSNIERIVQTYSPHEVSKIEVVIVKDQFRFDCQTSGKQKNFNFSLGYNKEQDIFYDGQKNELENVFAYVKNQVKNW